MGVEEETERIARKLAGAAGMLGMWELFLSEAYTMYYSGLDITEDGSGLIMGFD